MNFLKTICIATLLSGAMLSQNVVVAQQNAVQSTITKTDMQKAITNYSASATKVEQDAKYDAFLKLVFGLMAEKKAVAGGLVEGSPEYIQYMKFADRYNDIVLKKRGGNKTEIVAAMNAFVNLM